MAFLVIAGQTIDVLLDEASERAPERIGSVTRAFDGGLLTQVRAEKRSGAFTTAPMTRAAYETLRTNTALGAIVACSGDALPAATNCLVEIGEAKYIEDAAAGVPLFLAAIALRED